jgi:hypothetical protein
MTKTTEGGKTDVPDVGRLEWDHVHPSLASSLLLTTQQEDLWFDQVESPI